MLRSLFIVALCLSPAAIARGGDPSAPSKSAPWSTWLCLGNDGLWRQRIRITVTNHGDQPLEGQPVELAIGKGSGQADLEGARADALRLVNDEGIELLWALSGSAGLPIADGPIPAGSTFVLPADVPTHGSANFSLYFDNPAAWSVPDFLDAPTGLRNGGMEEGDGDAPLGWTHDEGDDQHRAMWVAEQPRAGRKCLKTVVAGGAEPTWISTRQTQLRIVGGARYRVTAWVRAAGVQGRAGWYVHVGNAKNSMIISPMLNGGGGSYDWKQVTVEFIAPNDADRAELGTVLRGTGTAWFDDVAMICLDARRAAATARALPPELRGGATDLGIGAPWPADAETAAWVYRAAIRVVNPLCEPTGGLISIDLSGLLARLNRRVDPDAVRVCAGTKTVEAFRIGQLLLVEGRVEPLAQRTFYVYLRRAAGKAQAAGLTVREYAANPALPGGQSKEIEQAAASADYPRLLHSPRNLVGNGDFEQGDRLPAQWSGGEGRHAKGVEMGFDAPGLFGRRAVKVRCVGDAPPQWIGWRQKVAVRPGKTYLLAAWLKCKDLAGEAQLHVHLHDAQGKLCRQQGMTGAGPAINGTTDWTLLQGMFTMPADAASFEIHLTMRAKGTLWHDGVVMAEVLPGRVGRIESLDGRLAATTAWQINAVEKVFQDDVPPVQPAAMRITAARNDAEPLQVALRSPRAIGPVRVEVETPVGPKGRRIDDFTVGVVGYVPVDHATNYYESTTPAWYRKTPTGAGRSDGWPGWWPDPILPRDTFDLAAQTTQPVWITFLVPNDAPAGDYRGKVRFTAAGRTVVEAPFLLHVWDFTLPDEMHIKAIFDCRQTGPTWAVPGKTLQEVREAMWRFMARRRACPDMVQPPPTLRYVAGRVEADFTEFDKAADYYFNTLKLPHSYTPAMFYAFGWGMPPGAKFGQQPYEGTFPFDGVDRSRLRPEFKQAYQACLKAFWEHIRAKGWERKFTLYISDEPFDSKEPIRRQMQALCDMVHEVDRTIPIYSSTWHHQPEWDGYLTVWGFGHFGIVPAEKLEKIRRDGATLWWTTDGQMCLDTPYCAVERLLPHYCFKYAAEAYEFWGIDWLTYDPYQRGWHRYIHQTDQPGHSYDVRYPNGDGYLVYPGRAIGHPGPVTSLRLEQAREGCEDYEYLYLLRAAIGRAKQAGRDVTAAQRALDQAQQLVTIPNAGGLRSTRILSNPDAVLEVKESVARAIESLR